MVSEVVPVLAVKTYFKLDSFLTYTCSVSRTGHFYSGGKSPGTYRIWVVWAPQQLWSPWRRDNFSPMPGIEPARGLVTISTEISGQSVLNICRLIRI